MKVLIFEDDPLLQEMYVTKYKQCGIDVVAYGDPSLDPVSIVLKEKPDIVSMDVVMPIMSGFEALERIKQDERTKSIPVILLTNLGQKEDIEKGMALGATDYIIKTNFMPGQVVNRFRKALGLAPVEVHQTKSTPAVVQEPVTQLKATHADIAALHARNTRVEADKAWETSFVRRGFIAAVTYVFSVLFMYAANNDQPWLYGFVPVMGYVLSTLSLPALKKWWMNKKGE